MEQQSVHLEDIEQVIDLLSLQTEAHERLMAYTRPGSMAELDLRQKLRDMHGTLYRMRLLRDAMNTPASGILH